MHCKGKDTKMKKYVIGLLAVMMIFTACARPADVKEANKEGAVKQPQQSSAEVTTEDSYFGQYQMSPDGFSNQVKDNAIDRDYKEEWDKFQKSPEFNTQSWVELENKYIGLWDKELNNTYNKLLRKLNEEEKKKLIQAQKGWLEFHTNESEFVAEAWEELGLGTQGRVQLVMAAKDRIRERTLQLMEYYYMLGGEVEFLYQGTK